MQTIERLAAEVRADIGLIGPIEAKVLAVWLDLELVAMPYPCDGLVDGYRVPAVTYYGMAGESCANAQIARGACVYLLIGAGYEYPTQAQTDALSALLCGLGHCAAAPTLVLG